MVAGGELERQSDACRCVQLHADAVAQKYTLGDRAADRSVCVGYDAVRMQEQGSESPGVWMPNVPFGATLFKPRKRAAKVVAGRR
ncbi:MAG: hypothetical protein U0703_04185 [Anaerolineae bacterium]